jgi:hypothetical protein
MTPFGNRDFERVPAPTAPGVPDEDFGWAHDDALARLLEQPGTEVRDVTYDTRRVIVRMHGGEDVEIGRAEGREPAVHIAREMVRAIEDAEAEGSWPLVGDRFLRPGAIVSIDVQRAG